MAVEPVAETSGTFGVIDQRLADRAPAEQNGGQTVRRRTALALEALHRAR